MNLHDLRQATLWQKIPVIAGLRQAAWRNRTASSLSTMRVAERWLLADHPGMDLIARLQVLEGVAGVKPWTWAQNPKQGLKKALAHFAEQGGTINPAWFSEGNTGMVRVMESIARAITKDKVTDKSPETVVSDVIMGMKADGELVPVPSLVDLGGKNQGAILSGKETPSSFGGGVGSKQVRDRATDQLRKYNRDVSRKGPQVRDDEETGQIEDPSYTNRQDFVDYLISKLMVGDAQGRALQRIMESAAKDEREKVIVDAFLNEARKSEGHRSVGQLKKDIGKQIGINEATVNARLVRSIIPRFKALLEKTRLYTKLIEQYQIQFA